MNHLDEDNLLRRVLELLEEDELTEQDRHLTGCSHCQARLDRMKQETELIGSIEPGFDKPVIPLPKSRKIPFSRLVKIAALLIIGFVAGYSVSSYRRSTIITVIPHHVSYTPESQPLTGFTVCE